MGSKDISLGSQGTRGAADRISVLVCVHDSSTRPDEMFEIFVRNNVHVHAGSFIINSWKEMVV